MGSRVYARLSREEADKLDQVRGVIKSPTYCRDAVMWLTALVEQSLSQMDRATVTRLLHELLTVFRPVHSRWDRNMARRVIISLGDDEIHRVNLARGADENANENNEAGIKEDSDSAMARNTFAYLSVVAKVKYALSQQQAVPSLVELGRVLQSPPLDTRD